MTKKMCLMLSAVFSLGLLCSCALWNGIHDDFSAKDWTLKANTVCGVISYGKNGMSLFNRVSPPGYSAAYKDFEVDLDLTPYLIVTLDGEGADGLIRVQILPETKRRDCFNIRENGVYSVNVAEKFKISGPQKLRVYIYNTSNNRAVTCKSLRFAMEKPMAEPPKDIPRKSGVVPTFTSASYYFTSPELKNIRVIYRKLPAGKWQNAYKPLRDNDDGNYRGSIVNLEENTDYVLKVLSDNSVVYSKPFRTWNSRKAIGKTIVLNKNNFKNELSKIESGKHYAWVRYTCAPGFVLTNDGKTPLIFADRIKYVIFDGLTLKGGTRNAVVLTNSSNVIFRNCNISGWGRTGVHRIDLEGKYYTGEKNDEPINFDGAISISECRNTVVERCYIHDPRGRANSWQYSHPAGPEAITIYRCYGTVIRYNDFVGSDEHRWNDAVESRGNFNPKGGINADADVYGNFMIFSSDDCIELDGGQQNLRCFGNRFEGAYCGVSVQGCMKGPSYVFDNWINDMGDEYGLHGQALKTSAGTAGKYAKCFVFNNTFSGIGNGTSPIKYLPMEFYNNVFANNHNLNLGKFAKNNANGCNVIPVANPGHDKSTIVSADPGFVAPELGNYAPAEKSILRDKAKKLDNFSRGKNIGAFQSDCWKEQLPRRPLPVKLDAATLRFEKGETEKYFTAKVSGDVEFRQEFSIVKNNVADWFEVTPAKGILQTNQSITFKVKLKDAQLAGRENWRGAFLLRFADGLSRPVAIYAKGSGFDVKAAAEKLNAFVTFAEAEKPVSGKQYKVIKDASACGGKALNFKAKGYDSYKAAPTDKKHVNTYEFTVPKDGFYTIALRIRAEEPSGMHDSFYASIDSEKMVMVSMGNHIKPHWKWCVPSGLRKISELNGTFGCCYLKKGKHVLRLAPREQMYLDAIGVTDNSTLFISW